jgi:hypothetical protein
MKENELDHESLATSVSEKTEPLLKSGTLRTGAFIFQEKGRGCGGYAKRYLRE